MEEKIECKWHGFGILWNDGELDILRQYFNGRKEQNQLIMKLIKEQYGIDRTVAAIKHKAQIIGLTGGYRCCDWKPEEIDKLYNLVGNFTPEQIATRLGRSLSGIKNKCQELNISLWQRNDWYTFQETYRILGVSKHLLTKWISSGKLYAIRYEGKKNVWKITSKSLKSFIIAHRCELQGRNTIFDQVVEILTNGINTKTNVND